MRREGEGYIEKGGKKGRGRRRDRDEEDDDSKKG
jgi:hypothetical protein